eukprot:gb/GEZN01000191.1/.p1 GENE.gb/GEZN01000191.1/~~gb/GEZN01000191.1/.p1  ORF type:complete len:1907 (-),score=328.53 gb/GEZN01000191.1/:145-5865(-)
MENTSSALVTELSQCGLLLWKNLLAKRHHRASTACEVLAPVLIFVLIGLIRAQVPINYVGESSNNADGEHTRDVESRLGNLAWTMACGLPFDASPWSPYSNEINGGSPNQGIGFAPDDPNDYQKVAAMMGSIKEYTQEMLQQYMPDGYGDEYVDCGPFAGTKNFNVEHYLDNYMFRLFESSDAMVQYVQHKDYGVEADHPPLYIGLQFKSMQTTSWEYTVRMNVTCNPWAGLTTYSYYVGYTDWKWRQYWSNGFMTIQRLVDLHILNSAAEATGAQAPPNFAFTLAPFPTPEHSQDNFASYMDKGIGLLLVIAFYWPFSGLVKSVVEEKELKLQEGMKMMGLQSTAFWLSWISTALVSLLCSCLLILALNATVFPVFKHSSPSLLLVWWMGYGVATTSMAVCLSTFFSRAKAAGRVAPVVMLALFLPYLGLAENSEQISTLVKRLISLFPPAALSISAVIALDYESGFLGVRWENCYERQNNFSMLDAIVMLYVDGLVYGVLAWYCSHVIPGEYGVRRPWYFPLTRNYWQRTLPVRRRFELSQPFNSSRPSSFVQSLSQSLSQSFTHISLLVDWTDCDDVAFDKVDKHVCHTEPMLQSMAQMVGVRVRGLGKTFNEDQTQPVKAVQGLELDLYVGQVFCFLGHNGAGKTTTINMLTGLLSPDEGDAFLFGTSIVAEAEKARYMMGVCPQHDALFPHLTVQEQLMLFAQLKQVQKQNIQKAVLTAIEEVELTEKAHERTDTLSGGQRRRLSLAVALIGDSKVVFLDEPTSGVDPASRRAIWDLILRKKTGRVIVLTTHFMDEADQLGDRIGIMHQGRMKCVGSPLFLKHLYGVGYSLTCLLRPTSTSQAKQQPADPSVAEQKAKWKDAQNQSKQQQLESPPLSELVLSLVPGAAQTSQVAAELSFKLPLAQSHNIAKLLEVLEIRQIEFGLDSYGLSVTTLEEVFIKVALDSDMTESERRNTICLEGKHSGDRLTEDGWILTEDKRQRDSWVLAESPDQPSEQLGAFSSQNDWNQALLPSSGVSSFGPDVPAPHSIGASNSIGDSAFNKSKLHELLQAEARETQSLSCSHLHALTMKRFHHTKRDKKAWCCVFFLPLSLLVMGLSVLRFPVTGLFPYMQYDLAQFGSPVLIEATSDLAEFLQRLNSQQEVVFSEAQDDFDSQEEFAEYLLANRFSSAQSCYGAFYQDQNIPEYPDDGFEVSLLTNHTAVHALPIFQNLLNQALLRYTLQDESASISVGFQAFDPTYSEAKGVEAVNGIFASVIISLSFSFIPASFAAFVVMEREINSKHLQMLSGVRPVSYWFAMYLWDALNFLGTASLCLLVLRLFRNPALTQNGNFAIVCLAVLLFGMAVIPFTYCFTFLFKSSSTAQAVMILVYILGGIVMVMLECILFLIPETRAANDVWIRNVFRLHPSYCLGDAVFYMCVNGATSGYFGGSNWSSEVAGRDLLFLALQSPIYFLLTLLLDWATQHPGFTSCLPCCNYKQLKPQLLVDDTDVMAERKRVEGGRASNDIIALHGLSKVFKGNAGPKHAVKDLWLGVPAGQCFGFLGVNGAGKTTTLRMITGDEVATRGRALINGLDLRTHTDQVRSLMGYCPQFDALHLNLTAVENLEFYGRIRGVRETHLREMVDYLIDRLNLLKWANKSVRTYSGGNKRKLSVAVALIGDPPAVFLDEPSTGIDPVSRRFMWDFISQTMAHRAVMLTTHSMEECEALCTRIGIIGNGELQCIGSAQHLKGRFGETVQIEVSTGTRTVDDVRDFILKSFPGAKEIECFGSKAKFSLPSSAKTGSGERESLSLAQIFRMLEVRKREFGICEYSVGQTTLEQVFLAFSKEDQVRQQLSSPSHSNDDSDQAAASSPRSWLPFWRWLRVVRRRGQLQADQDDLSRGLLGGIYSESQADTSIRSSWL